MQIFFLYKPLLNLSKAFHKQEKVQIMMSTFSFFSFYTSQILSCDAFSYIYTEIQHTQHAIPQYKKPETCVYSTRGSVLMEQMEGTFSCCCCSLSFFSKTAFSTNSCCPVFCLAQWLMNDLQGQDLHPTCYFHSKQ